MNKEQWRIKRTLPYVGYTLGNKDFSWDYVERMGEIYITDLRAVFHIHFISGEYILYSYPIYDLTPDYTEEKGFFGRIKKTKITDAQHYFDRNCETLQKLRTTRNKVVKAFYEYKRSMRLLKGQ